MLPSAWLSRARVAPERSIDPATFYELVMEGAGEDYGGWWNDPAWRPYRARLEQVSTELMDRPVVPGGLWDSA